MVALACLLSGGVVLYANHKLGQRKVVTIDSTTPIDADGVDLPVGDLSARNYLIAGNDSMDDHCFSKTSKFYKGIGNRVNYGERSDTIMVVRVNPTTDQVAILSFPRDLWVNIAGSNSRSRINSAFDSKNPNKLIQTIKQNFDVNIDHYVSIDFCTFVDLVNAVGGVKVPFLYKTKDKHTGLNVPGPGCFEFTGEHALAYVRSRHYSYYDPKVGWRGDGLSDWGRIARQQDFVRRVVTKSLEKAASNPSVASQVLNAALKNVVTDDRLTPIAMLQLAQAMKNYDSRTMGTYTVRAIGQKIGENSVLLPDMEDATMKKIFAIFRGQAVMAKVSVEATTTTTPTVKGATTTVKGTTTTTKASPGTTSGAAASGSNSSTPTTTLPVVEIIDNHRGIAPPYDPTCTG